VGPARAARGASTSGGRGGLARTIPTLGPTFVKIGQVFSARPDVVPEPYLGALSTLTDRVPCVPFARIEAELVAAYGAPGGRGVRGFEREPLAAGSLGQVYRARHQGQDVVVKVLRPGVEALVEHDVRFVRRVLALVERRWSHPQLRGCTWRWTSSSAASPRDGLPQGGRVRARHRRSVRGQPARGGARVVDGMVRRTALVLEFVEGTRVDRIEALVEAGEGGPGAGGGRRGGGLHPDDAGGRHLPRGPAPRQPAGARRRRAGAAGLRDGDRGRSRRCGGTWCTPRWPR
jgi:hypothetical protein